MAILAGENTVNTWVLHVQLAVRKRLVVLKGPIYSLSWFTEFRSTFGVTVCLKLEIVEGIFQNDNIAFLL